MTPIAWPKSVLVVALYHDYGRAERGLSYEYYNLFLPLRDLFGDVELYDFHSVLAERGKESMNRDLLATVRSAKPDLTVVALFGEELDPATVEELRAHTTTLCYFFDDIWRTAYADAWAPRFDYVTTPTTATLRRYRERGLRNVIYSPFGFNEALYRKEPAAADLDVSFVGGYNAWRGWLVKRLRKAGIRVAARGNAWPDGRIDQEGMVSVFNRTKINLNMSDSLQWDARYLLTSQRAIRDLFVVKKRREQIKARHFEIPACGGFQLSYYVEDLERCFEIGTEVAIYSDVDDLVDKVRYYLRNEDAREAIAAAGHRRAMAEHGYRRRFAQIAETIQRERLGLARGSGSAG